MNKWKIAFWSLLVVTFGIVFISFYLLLNQSVTLTYQKQGYQDTQEELKVYIELLKEEKLHYQLVKKRLTNKGIEFVDKEEEGLLIGFTRTTMRFDKDSVLTNIEMNW